MSKIPAQIFVVSKKRIEYVYPIPGNWDVCNEEDHNFGFLHPHEPNKATDAKRKRTQMQWAYSGEQYEVDGEWFEKGTDYAGYSWCSNATTRIITEYNRKIPHEYAPRVWDNVPLSGFKLIDTVNRYRGNKLFKVLDPRGVEFEITVQSLYGILCEGTVKNGMILDKCVWKSGKNLVVANGED